MTIDVDRVTETHTPTTVDSPYSAGWSSAAMAVMASQSLPTPVHLRMAIESHGPLLIDFRYNAFSWSTPLDQFPVDAVHTGLHTVTTSADAPPFFELPGQNLDDLLWEMGINAFGDAPAVWLSAGGRYRLTRWPNLTTHSHNLQQVRMIAILGNAYASAAELADLAGAETAEAQRLINALSLMRILSRSADAPIAVMAPEAAAASRQGLFARLRKRLGR